MAKEKKPVGRPRFFDTPEEMQIKIDEYFKKCEGEEMVDKDGEVVLNKYGYPMRLNRKPPTTTGLALALGFSTRQSLLDYQDDPQFLDTITRAKSRIEEYTEARLFDRDGVQGAKFSLTNNFKGWRENPVEDTAGQLEKVNENIENLAKLINNPVKDRVIDDE